MQNARFRWNNEIKDKDKWTIMDASSFLPMNGNRYMLSA